MALDRASPAPPPVAEVSIDPDLVHGLLSDQHPDLADLPLRVVGEGWDNVVLRLGDLLCVRAPRRAISATLVANEQRWLPQLAPLLPVGIPVPVRIGRPGRGYPWRWSVCPWFEGETLDATPAAAVEEDVLALRLADVLAALHRPAPPDLPVNPSRGIDLDLVADRFRRRLPAVAGIVDASRLEARFDELATSARWSGPPTWVHGDLHPGNLIVDGGSLVAVVDFGDICQGDPACDLAVAWFALGALGRARLKAELPSIDEATWCRARAWALHLGVAHLAHSAGHAGYRRIGARAVTEALGD